jgi:hypothetical protein
MAAYFSTHVIRAGCIADIRSAIKVRQKASSRDWYVCVGMPLKYGSLANFEVIAQVRGALAQV